MFEFSATSAQCPGMSFTYDDNARSAILTFTDADIKQFTLTTSISITLEITELVLEEGFETKTLTTTISVQYVPDVIDLPFDV